MNTVILLVISILNSTPVQESVEDIIRKVDIRAQPANLSGILKLSYFNAQGIELEVRELYYRRKRQDENKESVLIKITKPDELKNSAFLSINENKNSRNFFFLPELGIATEIKNSRLNSSFMNSDFYFSDLKSWNLEENNNRLIKATNEHYVIESIFNKAWYKQRMIISVRKDSFIIERIEFFNNKCELPIRILEVQEIQKIDQMLLMKRIKMTSFRECSSEITSSSEINYINPDIKTPLAAEIFTKRQLTLLEF